MSNTTEIYKSYVPWNPVTGCTKFSAGCKNCYALPMAMRLQALDNKYYQNGFDVTLHHDKLTNPLHWKKPRFIFVNSMSDLFHEKVPLSFIKQVFDIIKQAPWHTFKILTKRAERLKELASELEWHPNIWLGVTVESKEYLYRIEYLRTVPARTRFIFFEPLLGLIENINLEKIDWVTAGGESGENPRILLADWVRAIQQQCELANIPFSFHQWGGKNAKKNGRLLDGKIYAEMPKVSLQPPKELISKPKITKPIQLTLPF